MAAVGGGPRASSTASYECIPRLLLDLLPQLLVERREVPRARRPAAGLPLADRQPRRGHRPSPRRAGGPVQALSLPHHRRTAPVVCPQGGLEPRQGHRRDQEDDGGAGLFPVRTISGSSFSGQATRARIGRRFLRQRHAGDTGLITLIGDEPLLPYQRPPLRPRPGLGGDVGEDDLQLRLPSFYEEASVEVRLGVRAWPSIAMTRPWS